MLSEDRMKQMDDHVRKTCAENPDMEPWHVWSGMLYQAAHNMVFETPLKMSECAQELLFILDRYHESTRRGYTLPAEGE